MKVGLLCLELGDSVLHLLVLSLLKLEVAFHILLGTFDCYAND